MKALRFEKHGNPGVLSVQDLPASVAQANEAVVRVLAASVNPSDVKNVEGRMSQTTLPRTPGRDYSGVVVDGPAEWLGAEVWGSGGDTGFTREGTHAEYVVVPVASLRRKPANLTHEEASAIGVNFITAWCAVVDAAQLQPGETIAIIGRRQPGVAYGTPSSNFRSRRRARAAVARAGWGRRYIICCTAVEMFGQALLARSAIAR